MVAFIFAFLQLPALGMAAIVSRKSSTGAYLAGKPDVGGFIITGGQVVHESFSAQAPGLVRPSSS
jgi:hypothetical protein